MKLPLIALVTSLVLLGAAADQSTAHGEVTFDNRTAVSGDMYIDGSYRCRALSQLTRISQTTHSFASRCGFEGGAGRVTVGLRNPLAASVPEPLGVDQRLIGILGAAQQFGAPALAVRRFGIDPEPVE